MTKNNVIFSIKHYFLQYIFIYLSQIKFVMDYTDIIIRIIDRCQFIYEWFVRLFGHVVDLFDKIKNSNNYMINKKIAYAIKDKITTENEIEKFLRNYIEDDQLFV